MPHSFLGGLGAKKTNKHGVPKYVQQAGRGATKSHTSLSRPNFASNTGAGRAA